MLLILAGAAMALLLYVTEPGMVLTGDSMRYLMGAENMVAGNGFSRLDGYGDPKPIVGFPPAFPATISLFLLLGVDKLVAVKLINVFLFCANTFLVGWVLYRYSNRTLPAFLGSLAFLGFTKTLEFHGYALSEPGFVFLSLVIFLLLAEYQRKGSWWLLLSLGLCLGIVPLYRYVSLSLLPVVVLAILLFSRDRWKDRILRIVLLGITAVLPTFLWFQRNASLAGTTTNRSLAYHPIPVEKLVLYLDDVVSWFIPSLLQISWRPRFSHAAAVLAILTTIYLVTKLRSMRNEDSSKPDTRSYRLLPLFSLVFMYAYLATVFISASFLDASMSAYRRYLIPVFVYLVIFLLTVLADLLDNGGVWKKIGAAGFALWIFIFGFHFQSTYDSLDEIREYGAYDRWAVGTVEAGDFLGELDSDTVIITNEIDLVYLLTERYSFLIPIKEDNYTKEARDDFDHQMESYHEKMQDGAVLAIFDSFYRREFKYASYEELTAGLELIHVSNTVEIFADPDAFPVDALDNP